MNQGNNSEKWVVWYDGILDDLKLVTYLDNQLTDEERQGRVQALKRLDEKGVELPEMSNNPADAEKYANRQKVRSAVEFLRNRELTEFKGWKSREEALEFLTNLGIGEVEKSETKIIQTKDSEFVNYPLKPGAILKKFPGMKTLMKLILIPEYRETLDYVGTKEMLEAAGIDVEAIVTG